MKKIDVKELQRLTAEAIKKGKEKATSEAHITKQAEERRLRAVQREAVRVIENIPDHAEKAANKGCNQAIVMKVKSSHFIKPTFSNDEPKNLKDAAKLVWQHCVDAHLNPTLDYWCRRREWAGDGSDSGHNIVIHW